MQLTVAMCTYNPDASALARAAESVIEEIARTPAEFIVIDNNSSPPVRTLGVLDDRARIVEEPKPGLTAAREAAYGAAVGDVIVFVDDDNVLHPGFLETVAGCFEANDRLGILGASVVAEFTSPPPAWAEEFVPWLAVRPYEADFARTITTGPWQEAFPVGAGMSIRRDLALAYQDDCAATSRIEGRRGAALSSGEDIDMALYALERGYSLRTDGRLTVTHLIDDSRLTVDYLSRLGVSNVTSSLQLEEKWAPRLGSPVFPMFSTGRTALRVKALAAGLAGWRSPRFRIKARVLGALLRAQPRLHSPQNPG